MKKHLKGILASVLVLTLVLSIGACKKKDSQRNEKTVEKSDYIGAWKLTFFKSGKLEIEKPHDLGFELYSIIDENGKTAFVNNGKRYGETDWEFKDDHMEIKYGNNETITCKIENNKLAVSGKYNQADIECVFEKYTGDLPKAPAKTSDYLGKWKIVSAEAYQITIDDPISVGLEISLELKEDGSFSAIVNETIFDGGKWKEKDGGIEISGAGGFFGESDEVLKAKIEDEKLVTESEIDGMNIKMFFEKQKAFN